MTNHPNNIIDRYLKLMTERDGSDLHFLANNPPRTRRYGKLIDLESVLLDSMHVQKAIFQIMKSRSLAEFEDDNQCDFAYDLPGIARFRVNAFRHLNGMGVVMRTIPEQPLTLEQLQTPASIKNMCTHKHGLVLVTGKTGSGKSTTMAAMIDHINRTKRGHILTIEDPVEFQHQKIKSLISQREVKAHTKSFASALHSAFREDPDVILVGEMRDAETIGIAVTAAETGILVMGTLHTNSASATVDRIINVFPSSEQNQIRTMLSTSLRGIISQQLLPRASGKGRVAALEILVNNSAIGNMIRQGKTDQINNAMTSGKRYGMQSMDGHLKELVADEIITGEEAYMNAFNKDSFSQFAPENTEES